MEERDQLKTQLLQLFRDSSDQNYGGAAGSGGGVSFFGGRSSSNHHHSGNNNAFYDVGSDMFSGEVSVPMDSPAHTVTAVMGFVNQNKLMKRDLQSAQRELAETHAALQSHVEREQEIHAELESLKRRAAMRATALEAAREDLHKRAAAEMSLMMQVQFLQGRIRALEATAATTTQESGNSFPYR